MRDLQRLATPFVVASATLFVAVLFLDWRQVSVVAGPVQVDAGSWGWGGPGFAAGVLALALLLGEGLRVRFHRWGAELVTAIFAVGVLILAIAAFVEDSVDVDVAGIVSTHVGDRSWPAYLGLVLACVLALAAVVRAMPERHPALPRLPHPGLPG
jgi:hypothetical protein